MTEETKTVSVKLAQLLAKGEHVERYEQEITNLPIVGQTLWTWITEYNTLRTNSTYELRTIGHADEHHYKNKRWYTHLTEKNKTRVKVLYGFRGENMSEYIDIWKSLIETYGFTLVCYTQSFWRRGTDVKIIPLTLDKIDAASENYDYFVLFIENPNIVNKEDGVSEPPQRPCRCDHRH